MAQRAMESLNADHPLILIPSAAAASGSHATTRYAQKNRKAKRVAGRQWGPVTSNRIIADSYDGLGHSDMSRSRRGDFEAWLC